MVRRWLRLWRVERVEVASPLTAEEAAARLTGGLTSRRQVLLGPAGDADGRLVLGRASVGRVRLTARPRAVRNSWTPVFHGRLVPAGTGSRLVGTMGWHPLIKGFTAFWLTGVTLFTLGAAIAVAFLVATGQGIAGDLPIVLVPAAMLGFGSTLVGLAGRAGWRDADFLRGWLAERLQASGPR